MVVEKDSSYPGHRGRLSLMLNFDPGIYGVDVDLGTAEGERVGKMAALVIAMSMHEAWGDLIQNELRVSGIGVSQ